MINKLDTIARQYSDRKGFEGIIGGYKIKEILAFVRGPKILDLGCGEGLLAKALADRDYSVTGVDGSEIKLQRARKRLGGLNVRLVNCLFENYNPSEKFDSVIFANVLEHLELPVSLLKRAKNWLTPHGRLIATVPNSESLNRRLGLAMGLISNLRELTSADRKKGHRRVYSSASLTADFNKAGLKIIHLGGIFLKPFPHKIMEKIGSSSLNEGLYRLRTEFPLLCSSLIIVAKA